MKNQIMIARVLISLIFCLPVFSSRASAAIWPKPQPKLVVVIVIDQFRADYLSRFESSFGKDGFRALIDNGAYYPYGEYDILQSMTGPGHATILTGSYPYLAGIPINDWFDRDTNSPTYCVEDGKFQTVGAPTVPHVGTSPNNLVGTTVGDELKNAGRKSRVMSLALKDRAAILLGGHRADLSIWFDSHAKKWVSSTYYLKDKSLPTWVTNLNETSGIDSCDLETPCGIEQSEKAVEAMLKKEKLGQGPDTDILATSFSSHDYAGHRFGPNSPELEKMTITEDRAIASLRRALASSVPGGLKNVVFVLTGDHGVSPAPGYLKDTGIRTGRIEEGPLMAQAEKAVIDKCGNAKSHVKGEAGHWIEEVEDFNFFINEQAIKDSKCNITAVENEIKRVLLMNDGFVDVITRDEYERHILPAGMLGRQFEKTFYRGRSGDVIALPRAFFINIAKNFTTHMTGYSYDRMVPLLFSGFGIKPGLHADKAEVVDIAPTLSFLLGVVPPALSEGKVLGDAIDLKRK